MDNANSAKVEFLLNALKKKNTKQGNLVGQLIRKIKGYNENLPKTESWIPVANLHRYGNYFRVSVVGFNGKLHPVKVIFETGCDIESEISSSIAEKAGMIETRNGVSYVFVVTVGNREFIGYSIALPQQKSSVIEDMCGFSCVAQIENEPIDIIIGLRTIQEMSKCGINITASPETIITPEFQRIPFSYEFGLQAKIGEQKIKMAIDSGNFFEEDVTLSKSFVQNNKYLLKDVIFNITGTEGSIRELTIRVNNRDIKFTNLTFIALVDTKGSDGSIIDCVPGVSFMKRLIAHQIIVVN